LSSSRIAAPLKTAVHIWASFGLPTRKEFHQGLGSSSCQFVFFT
jgi:hypothetical protein